MKSTGRKKRVLSGAGGKEMDGSKKSPKVSDPSSTDYTDGCQLGHGKNVDHRGG